MHFAKLDANGLVIDAVYADREIPVPDGFVLAEDEVGVGWTFDGETWKAPPPPPDNSVNKAAIQALIDADNAAIARMQAQPVPDDPVQADILHTAILGRQAILAEHQARLAAL